jgi:quercetin dioxygenase-like cupin family protein
MSSDRFDVVRIVCEWRLRAADTGGQYCALHITVPPLCVTPLHHHVEQEAFFVLEGHPEFAYVAEGVVHWKRLSPGEMFNIPPHAVHAFRNPSDSPARCLLTAHAGMESFFVEVGVPVPCEPAPPAPHEIERLVAIAQKHGHQFLQQDAA